MRFAMDVDDPPSSTTAGFSEPWPASTPTWGSSWQTGRHDLRRWHAEFKPDLSGWKETKLDLNVNPQVFNAWQTLAISVLSSNRPDIRRLLNWAEKQNTPIDVAAAQTGAQEAGLG